MDPYNALDTAYRQLARRPPTWTTSTGLNGDLDAIVAAIRNFEPDSDPSDRTLRALIDNGRTRPDALTVVLHALAPRLRARLARTATGEYHTDALTELAFVILDSDLDPPRLAHRLVHRAHNRAWRHARRVNTRGVLNVITTAPCPPDLLARLQDHRPSDTPDFADTVVDRVDLERFQTAVETAVTDGLIPAPVWAAYRNHRLRRAVTAGMATSTSQERVAAHRAARQIAPYVDTYLGLHVA